MPIRIKQLNQLAFHGELVANELEGAYGQALSLLDLGLTKEKMIEALLELRAETRAEVAEARRAFADVLEQDRRRRAARAGAGRRGLAYRERLRGKPTAV